MLTNFKDFVNSNVRKFCCRVKECQSDVILTIGVILIALVSFGAGRLTAPQINQGPIIIQEPAASQGRTVSQRQTASIEQSLKAGQSAGKVGKTGRIEAEQGKFVGSVNSNKYHWPNCPSAKKIAPQNRIWFSSEEEARAAGYTRCRYFEKYAPPDYRP